jgi:hypothetical protein
MSHGKIAFQAIDYIQSTTETQSQAPPISEIFQGNFGNEGRSLTPVPLVFEVHETRRFRSQKQNFISSRANVFRKSLDLGG